MSTTLSTIVRTADALSGLLIAYCDKIAARFVRRTAIACLRGLDDRALRDIGLARSQIEMAVCRFVTPSGQTSDAMMESAAVPIHARTDDRRSNRGGAPWSRRLGRS